MIEIGVFHNGASDLPVMRTSSGVAINDGNLAEVHESSQRGLIGQVRQGILADKLGFNYFFMTEHHFQPEGAEFSPNPLLAETAIAARTRQIRLGQAANIVTWWHPIRIAEQAAMLDVISNGRLEFGIGRGSRARPRFSDGRSRRSRTRSAIARTTRKLTRSSSRRGRRHHSRIMGSSSRFRPYSRDGTISRRSRTSNPARRDANSRKC